jgi:hypothetical protein
MLNKEFQYQTPYFNVFIFYAPFTTFLFVCNKEHRFSLLVIRCNLSHTHTPNTHTHSRKNCIGTFSVYLLQCKSTTEKYWLLKFLGDMNIGSGLVVPWSEESHKNNSQVSWFLGMKF